MSDQALRNLCAEMLLRSADGHGGDVYTQIVWNDYRYEGLDLLWDGPDRVVAVAFCWDQERLDRAREDFLLFQSTCTMSGIYKKFHVIICQEPELGGPLLDWPVGISLSPVAVDLANRRSPSVPLQDKLSSILFQDPELTAAAMQDPPDWRRFLTARAVERRIRELADEAPLPPALARDTDEILRMVHEEPERVRELLIEFLTKRWRARS